MFLLPWYCSIEKNKHYALALLTFHEQMEQTGNPNSPKHTEETWLGKNAHKFVGKITLYIYIIINKKITVNICIN